VYNFQTRPKKIKKLFYSISDYGKYTLKVQKNILRAQTPETGSHGNQFSKIFKVLETFFCRKKISNFQKYS